MRFSAKTLAVLVLAAFCIYRLTFLFTIPLPETINSFADDAFYYLQIAQNWAIHGYPSFDSLSATNGFQPLWQILLVPFFIFTPHAYLTIYYAVQILQLLLFLLIGIQLYRLAASQGAAIAGLLTVLLLTGFFYWTILFNGMETALYLVFLLLIFGLLVEDRAFVLNDQGRLRGRWSLGFILGLTILARLDSIFYMFIAGAALVARWAFEDSDKKTGFIAAFTPLALPPAVLIGAYLLINKAAFGNFLPISGLIKSSFPRPELHPGFLFFYPWLTILGLYGLLVLLRFGKNVAWRKYHNSEWKTYAFEATSAVFAAGYWIFTGWNVFFMQWGVWNYYFVGVFIMMIPLSVDLVKGCNWMAVRLKSRWIAPTGLSGLIIFLLLFDIWGAYKYCRFRAIPFNVRTFAAADWLRRNTPPEAILAGTDCGILSYFSQRRTVNLDGLVNDFEYQQYLERGEFDNYLRKKGVDYLAIFSAPDSLFDGKYQTYNFSVWSNINRCSLGNLPLNRDWEVYHSQVDRRALHAETMIIVWQMPWSDQPLINQHAPNSNALLKP